MNKTTEVFDTSSEGSKVKRPVARVFFSYDNVDRVIQMRGLPLQNHLDSVALLTKHWDYEAAFGSDRCPLELKETRDWLVKAASRHDEGKARRFQLRPDGKRFTYSFSGHRFDVSDPHLYVQWLIRLHHGFSVDDVTEAQARLKQSGDVRLAASAHCFPLDLYALEMCDQIEAEAASHAFGVSTYHRVFMEFEIIEPQITDNIVRMNVFPYPFKEDEVHFTLQSFIVDVPPGVKQDGAILKQWLVKDGQMVPGEHKEIWLCKMK